MSVKVVHVRRSRFLHYIGRACAEFPKSRFYNPFHIGKDGTREEVLVKFIEYWYAPEQLYLRHEADMLIGDDHVLGCWCKPLDCHGDIIAGYLNWKRQEATLWEPPKRHSILR